MNFIMVMAILGMAVASAGTAFALTLNNDQAATSALGQANFTGHLIISTGTIGLYNPSSVAVDPTSGKVFVADTAHNRVMRFASLDALSNAAAADGVFGQSSFYYGEPNTSPGGMNSPQGVVVDSGGRLWVADTYNNRVLRFDHASSKSNGAYADGVLGQPDFYSGSMATTRQGMCRPIGVVADFAGRLWVTDTCNGRVLRFDNAASLANGANASGVLGKPDFTTPDSYSVSKTAMYQPVGITVDSMGRLWVSDRADNRVLRFDNAASLPNGSPATGVLGQPGFTSSTSATSQNGMHCPFGVTIDSSGRLWVADSCNNRVLGFGNVTLLKNGANASIVLGQMSFAGKVSAATAKNMNFPTGVYYSPTADVLWVADSQNNRVLRFGTTEILKNGGFNGYTGSSSIPSDWTASNFAVIDGKDTINKKEGLASVKITGSGLVKTLTQTLTYYFQGASGDAYVFSFWLKGLNIPTTVGACQGQVLFYSGNTLLASQTITCPTGTYNFQNKTISFVLSEYYNKILVKFTYSETAGSVWFDTVSLKK